MPVNCVKEKKMKIEIDNDPDREKLIVLLGEIGATRLQINNASVNDFLIEMISELESLIEEM